MFYIMVSVSTLLMVRSTLNMLRSRFIQPIDLAILSTWYYTVPLAVCGYLLLNPRGLIFLHAPAGNPSIAQESMVYAIVAMVALLVGQRAGKAMGAAPLSAAFALNPAGEGRVRLATVLLISMVGLGVLQFGIGQFFEGYATESDLQNATLGIALVYFAVGSLGLVIAYALLLYRKTRSRSLLFIIALAMLCALAVLLIRAKRLEIVTTLLPAGIILLAGRRSIKVTMSRVLLGLLAMSVLIAVSMIRVGDQFDPFTLIFYLFSEGLYAGHSLPGIIARLDGHMIGYENGARFVSAILGFVPRFLWPEKDDIVYAGSLALDGVSPLGATSILTEIVLQGGVLAVIVSYGLMGLLFDRASRFEEQWDRAIAANIVPGRFILYLVLITIFVPHFRDGIIPAIKLTLQAGLFMAVLVNLRASTERLMLPSISPPKGEGGIDPRVPNSSRPNC